MGLFKQLFNSWQVPRANGRRQRAGRAGALSHRRQWSLETLEDRALLAGDETLGLGILGYNATTAEFATVEYNGADYVEQKFAAIPPSQDWDAPLSGDFDGDGREDIVARDKASGDWWAIRSDGVAFSNTIIANWNPANDYVDLQVGDFNGDGRDDVAARNHHGDWWGIFYDGHRFANERFNWWNPQTTWDHVTTADVDGDGAADIVGHNQEQGSWFAIRNSTSGFQTQWLGTWDPARTFADLQFADFFGDQAISIAARDDATGDWQAIRYSNGHFVNSVVGQWDPAISWQQVVTLDSDADGRFEIVGRDSVSGDWWLTRPDPTKNDTRSIAVWNPDNLYADLQIGDFNGDGRSDLAARDVYGDWWALTNVNGRFRNQFLGSVSPSVDWRDVSNLDGGSRDSIVQRDPISGAIWLMHFVGTTFTVEEIASWDAPGSFRYVRLIDVDGDARDDLLGWNTIEGGWWAVSFAADAYQNQEIAIWNCTDVDFSGAQTADVNVDGRGDLVVFENQTGRWWAAIATGANLKLRLVGQWNATADWQNLTVADIDGNGSDDLIARNVQTGQWWAVRYQGGQFRSSMFAIWNPAHTYFDIQLADLNGDGRTDLVGRDDDGSWWATLFNGSSFYNQFLGGIDPELTLADNLAVDIDGDAQQLVAFRVVETGAWWSVGINTAPTGARWLGTWSPQISYSAVQMAQLEPGLGESIVGFDAAGSQWLTAGPGGTSSLPMPATMNPVAIWKHLLAADIDGDGRDELLGQVATTGIWLAVSRFEQTLTTRQIGVWNEDGGYVDVHVGDLDGDGADELVGRGVTTGNWLLLEYDGVEFSTRQIAHWQPTADWQAVVLGTLPAWPDAQLSKQIQLETAGLSAALRDHDTLATARLLLDWVSNHVNYALTSELEAATIGHVIAESASHVYYDVFERDHGAVWCQGYAVFYHKILNLFDIDSFVVGFGSSDSDLNHTTVIVPQYDGARWNYYVFDPTFNVVFRNPADHSLLSVTQILQELDETAEVAALIDNGSNQDRLWISTQPITDSENLALVAEQGGFFMYQYPGYGLATYLENIDSELSANGFSTGLTGFWQLFDHYIYGVPQTSNTGASDQFLAEMRIRGAVL